ncbi:MAG: endolytic transglycosylase MltG [Patescibacteria group bacterium]
MLIKKRKKNSIFQSIKRFFVFLLIVFFVIFFSYVNFINSSVGKSGHFVFVIEKGQGANSIVNNLHKEGVIGSRNFLKIYIKNSKDKLIFREGSYDLNYNMTPKEIIKELTSSASLKPEKQLTFIEGWNLRDYAKLIDSSGLSTDNKFFKLAGEPMVASSDIYDFSEDFSFLKDKPKSSNLEGYLFPDTYRFFEDATEEDIIIKMLRNFDQKLSKEMRDEIERQGKTIYEIITMASVIQKEVQSEKDMKMVSGLFWNRIKNGQALESCATLAYILGINKAIYSFEDTRINSPYNTYINRDLPPGPIANPGLKAIEAAIYPTENSYNYFLSRPDTGETVFSRTYEEHLINRNKYLR